MAKKICLQWGRCFRNIKKVWINPPVTPIIRRWILHFPSACFYRVPFERACVCFCTRCLQASDDTSFWSQAWFRNLTFFHERKFIDFIAGIQNTTSEPHSSWRASLRGVLLQLLAPSGIILLHVQPTWQRMYGKHCHELDRYTNAKRYNMLCAASFVRPRASRYCSSISCWEFPDPVYWTLHISLADNGAVLL